MVDENKEIKLASSDNEIFTVERGVAEMSVMVKNCIEDTTDYDCAIPISKVNAKVLAKVIEYCRYHHQLSIKTQPEIDVERWNKSFVEVDKPTLFHLILAANYLDIQPLLDLTCKTVADMIRGKTPEEIRTDFGIMKDFTEEEEEVVRRENRWCEDRGA